MHHTRTFSHSLLISYLPQHFLYFFPDPQMHGSFRPISGFAPLYREACRNRPIMPLSSLRLSRFEMIGFETPAFLAAFIFSIVRLS